MKFDFSVQASPKTHESRITCPVFLFHATGDKMSKYAESQRADQRMRELGIDVAFITYPGGDHYNPMIESGIPQAIEWMKRH